MLKALECFFDKCVDNAHKNAYNIFEGGERMKKADFIKNVSAVRLANSKRGFKPYYINKR